MGTFALLYLSLRVAWVDYFCFRCPEFVKARMSKIGIPFADYQAFVDVTESVR